MAAKKKKKPTAKKKCEAMKFPAGTPHDKVAAKLAAEWKKRNKRDDGTMNPNNYAPIYCVVGDVSMSGRRVGKNLILSAPVHTVPLPLPKQVW